MRPVRDGVARKSKVECRKSEVGGRSYFAEATKDMMSNDGAEGQECDPAGRGAALRWRGNGR